MGVRLFGRVHLLDASLMENVCQLVGFPVGIILSD